MMGDMRWWIPNPDEPQGLDWWRPLLEVAASAREEGWAFPLAIQDFTLEGKVLRSTGNLWTYRHRRTGGLLFTDGYGFTFRFLPNRTGTSAGRFQICSIDDAMAIAGIEETGAELDPVGTPGPYDWARPPVQKERSRGHLRLLPSAG